MIKEGVILAAGQGTRLRVVSGDKPKPLVEVNGKALLDYAVEGLLSSGIDRIIIIVGYEHEQIREHVAASKYAANIVFVQNDDWLKENGISVYAAREAIQGDYFVLHMVDHIFDKAIYDKIQEFEKDKGSSYLCIDKDIPGVFDLEDATKLVVADDKSIHSIAKELDDYNACDTGLFLMSKDIFSFFEKAIAQGRNTISNAVEDAGKAHRFFTLDVTGHSWIDVDSEEAWAEAEKRAALVSS